MCTDFISLFNWIFFLYLIKDSLHVLSYLFSREDYVNLIIMVIISWASKYKKNFENTKWYTFLINNVKQPRLYGNSNSSAKQEG